MKRLSRIHGTVVVVLLGSLLVSASAFGQAGRDQRRGYSSYYTLNYYVDYVIRAMKDGRKPSDYTVRGIDKYLKTGLVKPKTLNDIDSAHYAVCEIQIKQKQLAPCIKRLETVLAENKGQKNDTVYATHLNLGIVNAIHKGNVQEALRQYRLVQGYYQPFARWLMMRALMDMDRLDEAVAMIEADYKKARDPAQKLAMLWQIGKFYEQNKEYAKAIETYDRITREFTRDQMKEIERVKAIETLKDNIRRQGDRLTYYKDRGQLASLERMGKEMIRNARYQIESYQKQGKDEEAQAVSAALQEQIKRFGLENLNVDVTEKK